MLKLTLLPEEYVTIGQDIVVQLVRVAGGKANLAVQAPREVTILRGEVLEREGGQRPRCLTPEPRKKTKQFRDQVFRWNDDRERAVRVMHKVMDHLEQTGSREEAAILRKQLDRIIPAIWEDDLAAP